MKTTKQYKINMMQIEQSKRFMCFESKLEFQVSIPKHI